MASEIHSIIPQNNINQVNETVVDDFLTGFHNFHLHEFMNYGENGGYSHCNVRGDTCEYTDSNRSSPELVNIPLNLIPSSHYKMHVKYNSIKNAKNTEHGLIKNPDNFSTNNASKDYESDESYTSYSSRDSPDNGTKTADNQNDFYNRSGVFHPSLYQPNINQSKNSRYYYNGNRTSSTGNSGLTEKKVYGLMKRFQARKYKLRIDLNPPDLITDGPWDQLNQEMWNVFVNRIQTEGTYINKINLWKSIFSFLRMFLNTYGLYMVGSTMSGFGLEGSDIDLCLLTKPLINEPRIDSFHHLNRLKYHLLKNGLASEAELIMAKVPILKFKNKETGFEIDLNCNNDVGIQNTHLLYCYAQLDWRVRPLVVIVKIWAQANNINDAKNMTVSSYSWALMVIHYLQCGVTPPVLPCLHEMMPGKFNSCKKNYNTEVLEDIEALKEYESDNTRCLGDLLIGFFQYYSYFNYSQYAISVRTGSQLLIETCRQVKSPKNDPHQWKCLCIEEPFDLSNTARSVFDAEVFKHIRRVIMYSYKELARNKTLSHILPVTFKR